MRSIIIILFSAFSLNAQYIERAKIIHSLDSYAQSLSPIEGIWAIDLKVWSKDKVASKDLYMEVAIIKDRRVGGQMKDTIIGMDTFHRPIKASDTYAIYNLSRNEESRLIALSGIVLGSATPDDYWLQLDLNASNPFRFKMATIFYFSVGVELNKNLVDEFLKGKTKNLAHRAWYKYQRSNSNNAQLNFTRLYPKLEGRNYNYPTPERWGTCFAIDDEKKLLISNEHVVRTGDSLSLVQVWGVNGDAEKGFFAKVLKRDTLRDLALLQIVDERFSSFGPKIPYILVPDLQMPGTEAFVYGYAGSLLDDGYPTLAQGYIAASHSSVNKETAYKLGMSINAGHSGSPVFDAAGNVIGVAHSMDGLLHNISYAAKSGELIEFLKEAGITLARKSPNELTRLSLKEKVEVLEPFIYRITIAETKE